MEDTIMLQRRIKTLRAALLEANLQLANYEKLLSDRDTKIAKLQDTLKLSADDVQLILNQTRNAIKICETVEAEPNQYA